MKLSRILLVVVLIGGVAGAYAVMNMLAGKESTDDARVDGHIFPVSARVPGTVESVEVAENQTIEAGTVLLRIDDSNYRIALARAEADLATVQARQREVQTELPVSSVAAASRTSESEAVLMRTRSAVQASQKDLDLARAKLKTTQTRVRETQINAEKAGRDLERMKPLIAKDEISQQQYDTFVTAADAAKAAQASALVAVDEAQAGVALSEARVVEARAAVTIAETGVEAAATGTEQVNASKARISGVSAELQRARTAVEQARLDLERTVVLAPAKGIVSRKSVEKGGVIQAGQPLMAIVPLDDLWVTANFKETQLESMRPGQRAEISIDAFGSKIFHAQVHSIASATGATFSLFPAENASGNFVKVVQRVPVKLVFTDKPDPQFTLRPGMSAGVTVITEENHD